MRKSDYEALAQFRYQLRLFLRFSEDACQTQGITPLQYQLLLQTKGYPGRQWATLTELAERLQAKHHGVVALVSRCEALGLVQRKSSTVDLRQVEVHLTAKGERYVEKIAKLHKGLPVRFARKPATSTKSYTGRVVLVGIASGIRSVG